MAELTKKERTQLTRLAGLAYERELHLALEELETQFESWRGNEINVFDLSDAIHVFHDGLSRELFKRYNQLPPQHLVARAVALGSLTEKEVPESLRLRIMSAAQYFAE